MRFTGSRLPSGGIAGSIAASHLQGHRFDPELGLLLSALSWDPSGFPPTVPKHAVTLGVKACVRVLVVEPRTLTR